MDKNKLFDLQLEYFDRINKTRFTWASISRIDFIELINLVSKYRKRKMRIAEIGCYMGVSTIALGKIAKKIGGRVYAIDWFKGSPETDLDPTSFCYNMKNIFIRNIKENKLEKHIKIIEKTSLEASKKFPDEYFDFIFIDADHRYTMFKKDLDIWYPKLKKNGIISGHDADIHPDEFHELDKKYKEMDCILIHVGIIKALIEKFKDIKIKGNSKIWYCRKKNGSN